MSNLPYLELKWIEDYTKERTSKLITHIRAPVAEQERIAILSKLWDPYVNLRENEAKIKAQEELQRRTGPPEHLLDPDEDLYCFKFEANQKIDFQYYNQWYQGVIEVALDEMIKCTAYSNEK